MNEAIKKRLIEQGFSKTEVLQNKHIISLSRWTPFSCATFGILGLILQSPTYSIILGLLTLIGPLRPWSFYDYIYKYFFSYFIKIGEMPKHAIYRRIGCAMGAAIFILSGIGFYTQNLFLAFFPSCMIITIAIISGITGWCFVSSIHHVFKKREIEIENCC